jgi:flagellar hook assembly protein FlgD
VFDQPGRRVRTLADAELPSGEHAIAWDGRDEGGRPVASALYFVRLETDGLALTRRLAVVR